MASSENSFLKLLQNSRHWVDQEIATGSNMQNSPEFRRAMLHVMLGAGKAFRPALCFWTYKNIIGESYPSMPPHLMIKCGFALEMMHTYSLVHDDLPAMDNDPFRRGRPTLHVLNGEAFAILAGDALLTESFSLLAEAFSDESEKISHAIRIFSHACGALGMIKGQWQDICSEQIKFTSADSSVLLKQLENIHDLKTGALLGASVALGALKAMPLQRFKNLENEFYQWGVLVGRLFQMVDDCLDVSGESNSLGKTAGKDAQQEKLSYPALLGYEGTLKAIDHLKLELESQNLWIHHSSQVKELLDFVSRRSH